MEEDDRRTDSVQKRWKEIGPVPRRYSDAVWKRFRAACDRFFERKSAHFSGVDAQHEENLQAKLALLTEMEAADISEGGFEMIKEFQKSSAAKRAETDDPDVYTVPDIHALFPHCGEIPGILIQENISL